MAVMPALLGFTSERRWLRYVRENLTGMFRGAGKNGVRNRVKASSLLNTASR